MAEKVSVIIVTYNGIKWIDKCVGFLRNSTIPVTPIIVDNCSTDGTTSLIELTYPEVILIKSDVNLGFGKGNNIGLQKALTLGCDYFFLLNQDAWIESNTVEELILAHQNNLNYGILSPVHLNGLGDKLDFAFSHHISATNTPNLLSDLYFSRPKQIYESKFINAAAWLISRSCLEAVGLFDPIFPHYGEDDDYAFRTLSLGYKIGVVPKVKIYHDRNETNNSNLNLNVQRSYIRSLLKIKNSGGLFWGRFIYALKTDIDTFFTFLMYRRFKEARVKVVVIFRLVKNLKQIHKSYLLTNKSIK
ncbi:glycosyltransferase family 2 protein [Pontibacter diazotrophicus]|uniref:Glycosyltransferase family 2 protein n=1 Tax=Pontibacter diazotrophicus TaxID=1400979 RepID=A0A3D8LBQ8_9BACT|nr:glycosyltransferase family 2 protein [Pontibacter diazotrophicus]RDV14869.1 glycosyltransferase family 2 protein [Pontibacter diazotrophicus]